MGRTYACSPPVARTRQRVAAKGGPKAQDGNRFMSKFPRFGNIQKIRVAHNTGTGDVHVDWKDVETLRRLMSPNGKILGRKRLSTSAREQRMVSQAIKRARYMSLLPYTSATL